MKHAHPTRSDPGLIMISTRDAKANYKRYILSYAYVFCVATVYARRYDSNVVHKMLLQLDCAHETLAIELNRVVIGTIDDHTSKIKHVRVIVLLPDGRVGWTWDDNVNVVI